MIFVTVGSALPFDRLIRIMDDWTGAHPGEDVYAQIGDGAYEPVHMRWVRQLRRLDYGQAMASSELIVAHAGVGSVVTASEYGRPIVLLPRLAKLGEHRNDHQLDTAAWLCNRPGVHVAKTDEDVSRLIEESRGAGRQGLEPLQKAAPPDFLRKIREFALK